MHKGYAEAVAHKGEFMDRTAIGFKIAALYNAFIILFSKGFAEDLGAIDPLFSSAGCVAVLLWGAAYFTLANRYQVMPALCLVFGVEKGFYAIHWMVWLSAHAGELGPMFNEDPLTGFFYAIYGAGDLIFMVFFLTIAWTWRHTASHVIDPAALVRSKPHQ